MKSTAKTRQKSIYDVCRLCLKQQQSISFSNFHDSKGERFTQVYLLTDIKIDEDPNIPTLICKKCLEQLDVSTKFRRSIIKANELYLKMLEENQNPLPDELEEEQTEPMSINEVYIEGEPEQLEEVTKIEIESPKKVIQEVVIPPKQEVKKESRVRDISPSLLDFPPPIKKQIIYQRPPPNPPSNPSAKKSRKESRTIIKCDICDLKLVSELERQEHIITVHDPVLNERKRKERKRAKKYLKPSPDPVKGPTDWMCSYCLNYFADKFDMLMHRKREHGKDESTKTCPQCDTSFINIKELRSHIALEHAIKRFVCPNCGEQFARKHILEFHMLQEKGEKNFLCHYCDKNFLRNCDLNRHVKANHENFYMQKFMCDLCGISIKKKFTLKKHFWFVHLKLKPLECKICLRKFSVSHHLKGHMERVHLLAKGQF